MISVRPSLSGSPTMGCSHQVHELRNAEKRHVPGAAFVDPQEALVGVDRLGFAVAFEVENGRAGARRRGVLRGLHPAGPFASQPGVAAVSHSRSNTPNSVARAVATSGKPSPSKSPIVGGPPRSPSVPPPARVTCMISSPARVWIRDRAPADRNDLGDTVELGAVEAPAAWCTEVGVREKLRRVGIGRRSDAGISFGPSGAVPSVDLVRDQLDLAVVIDIAHDRIAVENDAPAARADPVAVFAAVHLAVAANDLRQAVIVEIVERHAVPIAVAPDGVRDSLGARPHDVELLAVPLVGDDLVVGGKAIRSGDDLHLAVTVEIGDGRRSCVPDAGPDVDRFFERAVCRSRCESRLHCRLLRLRPMRCPSSRR